MPPSRINLRELQTPLKTDYQQHPEAARILLNVEGSFQLQTISAEMAVGGAD